MHLIFKSKCMSYLISSIIYRKSNITVHLYKSIFYTYILYNIFLIFIFPNFSVLFFYFLSKQKYRFLIWNYLNIALRISFSSQFIVSFPINIKQRSPFDNDRCFNRIYRAIKAHYKASLSTLDDVLFVFLVYLLSYTFSYTPKALLRIEISWYTCKSDSVGP